MKHYRLLWQGFFWLNWAVIFYFWFQGSGTLLSLGTASVLIAFGRLSGLVAAYLILLQFMFIGRTPWLERFYGLDKLSRFHQLSGKTGFFFLLLHPFLLISGYSIVTESSFFAQFFATVTSSDDIFKALIGLLLFIVVIASSIYISRSRLKYETWYFVHLSAYIAVLASFSHQFEIGTDIISNKFFYGYWVALYVIVFVFHIAFRFVRPWVLYHRHRFEIHKITRESSSVFSLYITGRSLERFSIRPGQFMILRFLTKELWWQAHPFSLSMVPEGSMLRITVKEVGDFTRSLADINMGSRVFIDGPYGIFTDFFGVTSKVLMIAGGIGITPIRSLVEQLLKKGKQVTLLYGNQTFREVVFRGEFEALSTEYPGQLEIVYVMSNDPEFQGEQGKITEEKISKYVPDIAQREVFICGPSLMMTSLIQCVQNLGVRKDKLHFERFSL